MTDTASLGLKIRDKVILITGGARGIGLATATALHNLGAKVAIGDIDEVRVKESGAALGLDVYGKLDVTDAHSFSEFLDGVERQLGPIDVLINNAGIMPVGRIIDEPDAVTRRILDINVYGVILGSKLAARRMVPRGSGHVINVASLAGEIYAVGLATYCASKHAVIAFTDAARIEYRSAGVKFSAVLPTFVNTELTAGTTGAKGFRNAEPGDIADAIVNLIARPRPKVRVTRAAGAMVASQKFMPRRLAEGLNRALGGEHVFTDDVDVEKRKAYEARARGEE
jgi:NAD(P)-dependent dehydrogenase (short-subunit alcohol dehydrogenase family)